MIEFIFVTDSFYLSMMTTIRRLDSTGPFTFNPELVISVVLTALFAQSYYSSYFHVVSEYFCPSCFLATLSEVLVFMSVHCCSLITYFKFN